MLKGIVKLEFVDVESGEVTRTHEQENFIFFEDYAQLWTSSSVIQRPVIIGRGTDVYPYYDKDKNYFGRHYEYITGYAPAGTQKKKFFQKTENSPAYWDFYSLFLPPAVVSSIPCIGLSTVDNDNTTHGTSNSPGNNLITALNLDPYCYQSPTEYLNVYYRLILIEDDKNLSPDFIRNQFVLDIDRGNSKVIFPNVDHKLYPFRIEQDLTRNGFVNFIGDWNTAISNKTLASPTNEHGKLVYTQKTYTFPDENPNQYTQINYGLVNTVVRGVGSTYLDSFSSNNSSIGMRIGVNPIKITPQIGASFTGIGNVFSASGGSASTMFDAAYFPAGSGRMQVSGILSNVEKDAFPSVYQCEITKEGQHWDSASYRVYEHRLIGVHNSVDSISLPLLPVAAVSTTDDTYIFTTAKELMYKNPNSVHMSPSTVKYQDNRSFITWDSTGITMYDIYHGRIECFDIATTPSLAVTAINDVKVDTHGNIWISCSDTGLWKLKIIDEVEIQLTHIGVLPGSQQKCYAIDVDNFGNTYAIFWGMGLFYTANQGVSWVNVPIEYAPFSGYESGGFVSKWSYVARMICNPERNATLGTAQLLILMKTSSPDYAASGGCWYDFQSQITTGITNTLMKGQLTSARNNRHAQNIQVSDYHNTWFFLNGGNELRWCTFQHNATMPSYTSPSASGAVNTLDKEWCWDRTDGILKEYLYLGLAVHGRHSSNGAQSMSIFDIATKTAVKTVDIPVTGTPFGGTSGGHGGVKLGKNIYVTFARRNYWATSRRQDGFFVHDGIPFSKANRQWGAVSWGWNGSEWVKNHLGNKPIHQGFSDLFRGAQNKFTDGHVATTSWALGDTFTFTVFDGFFKDNSSTMALRDTIYYKPTEVCEVFTPSVITRIDKSGDIGIVNSTPIELDWNIDDLPDTVYSGGSVITNGDQYFNNVSYLALFNTDTQLTPTKGTHFTTVGAPAISTSASIFGQAMVELNGTSGFYLEPTNQFSLTSQFTIEGMFRPSETGVKMFLFDFRATTGSNANFFITADGRLGFGIGSASYGNSGAFLFPGTTYYIAFKRVGNVWSAYLDGVKQFEVTDSTSFTATAPLHVFKRFQTSGSGWEGFRGWASNIRITRAVNRNVEAVPTAFFPTMGNSYTGAAMVLSGTYNSGSIVSKRELVGNWEVIFRNVNSSLMQNRRSRPKLAFGVSVLKFIESVTDISYRMVGDRMGTFKRAHSNSTTVPVNVTDVKITKVNGFVSMLYSTDSGISWTNGPQNIQDLNPLHHICYWQVQGDTTPMTTPTVEIISNGSAIFSKIGAPGLANGYHNPKFLAADVYYETDVNIKIQGTQVTKVRSNFSDPALPLKGEVLALMGGTVVFHEEDLGKTIEGRMITLRD